MHRADRKAVFTRADETINSKVIIQYRLSL